MAFGVSWALIKIDWWRLFNAAKEAFLCTCAAERRKDTRRRESKLVRRVASRTAFWDWSGPVPATPASQKNSRGRKGQRSTGLFTGGRCKNTTCQCSQPLYCTSTGYGGFSWMLGPLVTRVRLLSLHLSVCVVFITLDVGLKQHQHACHALCLARN